jgi:hypothetical protein
MTVIKSTASPAEVLGTLRDGDLEIHPTERWSSTWSVAATTINQNVYGLYARSIPLTKWLSPGIRDLLEHYPGDVGSGSMPAGLTAFTVPETEVEGLGSWVLLYVGVSQSRTARIQQYFGTGPTFTRGPGGQSLHLTLALFFGDTVDPRITVEPKAVTLEYVLRGSLSLTLEHRMREMRLAYVQVETPPCTCPPPRHSVDCRCLGCSEAVLLRDSAKPVPPTAGWPPGARPMINSRW